MAANVMQNERHLRLLAEQTREHAIMLFDLEGRITWWNPAAERIFGIPAVEALGQPATVLFTRDAVERGLPGFELSVASAGARAENDRWLARGDGSTFWANGVTIALREDGRVVGYGKILRNRTDLMEQIETLRNQVAALESRDGRKDVFLSTVAHELRNPLSPMANALQLIRISDALTPALVEPLRILERQIDTLRRLVDDLLDLTRAGTGKIELKKQRISMQLVLEQAVDDLRSAVQSRRHALQLLVPPAEILVDADRDRLRQVFVNLIQNAVKYTPEGGHIWIKATTEAEDAVVHIEDTGVGIPTDMQPHIFDLFTQVESARPHSKGGLGIGLSVVKDLVALHGGSVQARSDGPGKGSVFTVRLPLAQND